MGLTMPPAFPEWRAPGTSCRDRPGRLLPRPRSGRARLVQVRLWPGSSSAWEPSPSIMPAHRLPGIGTAATAPRHRHRHPGRGGAPGCPYEAARPGLGGNLRPAPGWLGPARLRLRPGRLQGLGPRGPLVPPNLRPAPAQAPARSVRPQGGDPQSPEEWSAARSRRRPAHAALERLAHLGHPSQASAHAQPGYYAGRPSESGWHPRGQRRLGRGGHAAAAPQPYRPCQRNDAPVL